MDPRKVEEDIDDFSSPFLRDSSDLDSEQHCRNDSRIIKICIAKKPAAPSQALRRIVKDVVSRKDADADFVPPHPSSHHRIVLRSRLHMSVNHSFGSTQLSEPKYEFPEIARPDRSEFSGKMLSLRPECRMRNKNSRIIYGCHMCNLRRRRNLGSCLSTAVHSPPTRILPESDSPYMSTILALAKSSDNAVKNVQTKARHSAAVQRMCKLREILQNRYGAAEPPEKKKDQNFAPRRVLLVRNTRPKERWINRTALF